MKYKRIFLYISIVFLVTFLFSGFQVLSYYLVGKRENASFCALEKIVDTTSETPEISETVFEFIQVNNKNTTSAYEEENNASGDSEVRYERLHDKNPDYWGWIKIDGTKLSYPVMFTPDRPEYYLHRDFDGNYSSRGVPFLDADCSEKGGNLIIHGHHMKDGSMFTPLISYRKQDFYKEHPVIRLETENGSSDYLIFAAFYSRVYNREEVNVFRYYRYTSISDIDTFNEYIEQIKNIALYNTGVDVTYGKTLLTLSTCDYHDKNGRFVVVAQECNYVN